MVLGEAKKSMVFITEFQCHLWMKNTATHTHTDPHKHTPDNYHKQSNNNTSP